MILAAVSSAVLAAQGPATDDFRFEVASVRQNTSVSSASSISGATPGRFTVTNTPLRFILLHAYQLRDHQLIDAPDWTWSAAYDIVATYPAGSSPSDAATRAALRALLADRFQLTVRREKRQMPVYRLMTARGDGRLGAQLVRSTIDCEKWIAEKRPQMNAGGASAVAPGGRRPACLMTANRRGYLTGGTRTIAELSTTLQSFVGRPVIDATGLQGTFDIDLLWTPNGEISAPPAGVPVVSPDGPSLFTAIQEQLGLKLEAGTGDVDAVVIERIERPAVD